ncbi:unnamed protein product [Bursaphelenchus okinawaensis]|uniref:Helicase ATP-binding domain-containing protein n=1 Tax=Bursaphelenchus okinawaensis TaxID=465554 RepID=A0A811LRB0_9BILA|nr:unnamed protein product [Bursaphelenchus okinawaensis]CAG9127590.1 unnamed protein product [Bursaphelenchus okinawaensis]
MDKKAIEKFDIPWKYKFLLNEPEITEASIKKSPELKKVLSIKPKTIKDRIERNIAVLSLYYARDFIRSIDPVFERAIICQFRYHAINDENKFKWYAEVVTPAHRRNANSIILDSKEYLELRYEDDLLSITGKAYGTTENGFKIRGIAVGKDAYRNFPTKKKECDVYIAFTDFVPKATAIAISNIQKGTLNEIIMPKPNLISMKKFNKELPNKLQEFVSKYPANQKLNDAQLKAVYTISQGLNKPSPFILFGPPGTGKTVTIVSSVMQLIRQDDQNRILICTPSNAAADKVALELVKEIDEDVLTYNNLLRLTAMSADYERREKKLDRIVNLDEDCYCLVSDFKPYRIVITTLSSAVRLVGEKFTHIIVDEAGQAMESELWIPIGICATKNTSVIFCGDPKQLGPVNIMNLPSKYSGFLDCPLNRYLKMSDYSNDVRLCVRLSDCFRCHGSIVHIASELFYKSRLMNSGDKTWKQKLANNSKWLNKGFSIAFIDSKKSNHIIEPNGASVGNPYEAKVVCDLLSFLNKTLAIDFDKIGIVSPYKYHTKLVKERILKIYNDKVLDMLTVDSVERFQGSEREVIIMTTARTQKLGFLACDLRLNTAITRAQRLLIVVGHRKNLERHGNWKKFIKYVQANDAVYQDLPFKTKNGGKNDIDDLAKRLDKMQINSRKTKNGNVKALVGNLAQCKETAKKVAKGVWAKKLKKGMSVKKLALGMSSANELADGIQAKTLEQGVLAAKLVQGVLSAPKPGKKAKKKKAKKNDKVEDSANQADQTAPKLSKTARKRRNRRLRKEAERRFDVDI